MVRPRGSQWQIDFSHNGERYRKDFPTRAEAQAWEIEMRSLLIRGKTIPSTSRNGTPRYLKDVIDLVYDGIWS